MQIGSPVTIEAKGAAVIVPITIVCAVGTPIADLSVDVVEAVGSSIAHGRTGLVGIACTGEPDTMDVVVLAENKPFRRGTAFVSANFVVYDRDACLTATDDREVRVR